jgi:hypothetical protein
MVMSFSSRFANGRDFRFTWYSSLSRCVAMGVLFAFFGVLEITVKADLLSVIAPDTLVVVGDNAPELEAQAAQHLATKLVEEGGPRDNLVLASVINADLERAASHHLMVVGTAASNRVLQRLGSHWVLNRDLYYADHTPYESFMPTKGYYAAGYGTFTNPGDAVGYVEWDRNPYWHYATNLEYDAARASTPTTEAASFKQLPYRQIVRITGNSSAGVVLAVNAVLDRHLLTGVVTEKNILPGPMSPFSIDTAHAAWPEMAPSWIPTSELHDGDRALLFAGWHLADSMTYSGFEDASGQSATLIWRAKYLTETLWNYAPTVVIDPAFPMTRSPLFEASLARRASGNEFFVAELPSAQAATSARDGLIATLNRNKITQAPWHEVKISGVTWSVSRFDTSIAARGPWVVMESFDAQHSPLALKSLSAALASAVPK